MAAVLAQRRLRRFLEGVQHIQRHKGLGGTTEATAVDTDSAPPLQNTLAQGDGDSGQRAFGDELCEKI